MKQKLAIFILCLNLAPFLGCGRAQNNGGSNGSLSVSQNTGTAISGTIYERIYGGAIPLDGNPTYTQSPLSTSIDLQECDSNGSNCSFLESVQSGPDGTFQVSVDPGNYLIVQSKVELSPPVLIFQGPVPVSVSEGTQSNVTVYFDLLAP